MELYEQRLDKGYSLTDCISMIVMRQMGIQEVLSKDKHFSQEGFNLVFNQKKEDSSWLKHPSDFFHDKFWVRAMFKHFWRDRAFRFSVKADRAFNQLCFLFPRCSP